MPQEIVQTTNTLTGEVGTIGNRHGLLYGGDVSAAVEKEYGPLLAAQVDSDLGPILHFATQRSKELASDGRLTAAGKHHEKRALGAKLHDQLDQFAIGGSRSRARKIQTDLANMNLPSSVPSVADIAKRNKESDAATVLRHQEIRKAVHRLDPIERRTVLMEAAHAGDHDTISAICGCSPLVRPVDATTLEEAKQAYLDACLPPEANVAAQALKVYDSNIKTAAARLAEITGVNGNDAPARAAAKDPSARPARHHDQPTQRADSDSKLPRR